MMTVILPSAVSILQLHQRQYIRIFQIIDHN